MRVVSTLKTLAYRTARRALRDTSGATAVEYALIIAMVVLVLLVGLTAMATPTVDMWTMIDTKVSQAR